jgi:DUF4097 and DUF4098 domain-containing protein YvlB
MSSRFEIATLAIFALCVSLIVAPALAETRIERSFELAPGGRLVVDTDRGSVTVTGTSGSDVRMVVTSSRGDLEEKLAFQYEESANEVRIEAKKRGRSWLGGWSFKGKLQFELEVPEQTQLDLETAGGAIEVRSIDAEVRLDTSGGPILATGIGGSVDADTSGGPISIEDVDGDVKADTSGGNITVERVRGDVSADTSGGGIRIHEASGDVEADTSGGSIDVRDAGGRVVADTSGGTIEVSFAPGNSRGGSLSTSGGGIHVALDASAALEIDAETSGGAVESDLPLTVQGKITRHSVHGTLGGGGETLRLRASGGDIRIAERVGH